EAQRLNAAVGQCIVEQQSRLANDIRLSRQGNSNHCGQQVQLQVPTHVRCCWKLLRKATGPQVLSKQTRRMQSTCCEQDCPRVKHATIRESHADNVTRIVAVSHEIDRRDAGQQLEIRQPAQLRQECGLAIC